MSKLDSSPLPENNSNSPSTKRQEDEQETSLIDLLLIIVRNRRLITLSIVICAVFGLSLAIFSPSQYVSSARVIREVEAEGGIRNMGGLSLLRGIGVNLGGSSSTGLSPDAYPDILISREVRLAVVRDSFYFRDLGRTTTFTEYANQTTFFTYLRRFTIGLPRTIRRMLQPPIARSQTNEGSGAPIYPTAEEEQAMKTILDHASSAVDQETGLMVIAATTQDPALSADLTNSFVRHLVQRIETIRTEKAERDLQFIRTRFRHASDSLRAAENNLARFEDRNTNPQSARLITERARLQRQVSFKSELYSDLQAQLTQAEIDLQRSRPVITILEQPVPPLESSGPRRFLLLAISIIFGAVIGIVLSFTHSVLEGLQQEKEGREKIAEIKNTLPQFKIFSRFRNRNKHQKQEIE